MIFLLGIDQWRTETDWPLPDTHYRAYYLHGKGQANSLRGDGTLSTAPPGGEPSDAYLFDPFHPVPTVGGQVILPGATSMGPRDQREVEVRDDVLVYTSSVLDRPVEVIGPVELRLWASSSAPDTDFTGKLVDVHPDGRDHPHRRHPPRPLPQHAQRGGAHGARHPYEFSLNLGELPTCSCRATASGSRSPAATFPNSTATATSAATSPVKPPTSTSPRSTASTTTQPAHPDSSSPSSSGVAKRS